MRNADAQTYSWILRGSQRAKIIRSLARPKTPAQIQKHTKIKFSNISDNLRLMAKENLVVCLTPQAKTGRIYKLTRKGEKFYKILSSQ